MDIARNLRADEVGLFIDFVFTVQLHLCHHKTGIVAMKLINLKGM